MQQTATAWCCEQHPPVVLMYPTTDELIKMAAERGGEKEEKAPRRSKRSKPARPCVRINTNADSNAQIYHVDQDVGCATKVNFISVSKGGAWTDVSRIGDRQRLRLAASKGATKLERRANFRAAVERESFATDWAPDGSRLALCFSSGTPHRGVGNGPTKTRRCAVFFQGGGPAAHLEHLGSVASAGAKVSASRAYHTPSARNWCQSDAVVPLDQYVQRLEDVEASLHTRRDAGPCSPKPTSRSLRRALLMPQVNSGSFYRCSKGF